MSKARDIASAAPAPSTVSATEIGYLDGVTSAIQTQLDAKTAKSTLTTTGDIYYASAANTPARLGIGTASQLLAVNSGATAPEWVAAPSSGGMTLISTTTLSSSGSFNINGCFSSAYDNYRIIFNSMQGSASSFMAMGLRTGSTNATADYKFGGWAVEYANNTISPLNSNSNARITYLDWGSTSTTNAAYTFDFFNPFKTTNTTFSIAIIRDVVMSMRGGTHEVATSYDSLWFTVDSGTVSGSISIFGLAK
jgi:hypothetical protein